MHKLSVQLGDDWVPHSHPATFSTEATTRGDLRLVAGVPDGDSSVLLKLVDCLGPPFIVLYVLHTPRGEGAPGRYQSPDLELGALQAFVAEFSPFFSADARFDLWVHSPSDDGTIVWDRHNILYGYGPLDRYGRVLSSLGFANGKPGVPVPHMHHYRRECDGDAAAILSAFTWRYTRLHPEDEQ